MNVDVDRSFASYPFTCQGHPGAANVRLATREGRRGESRRPSPPRPPPRSAHSASWPNFEDHYLTAIKTAAAASRPVAKLSPAATC
ncbi:hypothetical protein SKAU_G00390720 [Synaphobranchus kaupii]|uniref:Uncharacterized protein n=1 Tax=Synaphobranchus kaupii TaxID=118154 RepID=A0A9Q1ICR6_SYNKA|nr:hypothetical protein SKAU_G00390720 [Synaphobranchus kaupii]